MIPRRMRRRQPRPRRQSYLTYNGPLTVEQIKEIERRWQAAAGRPMQLRVIKDYALKETTT